MCDQLWAGQVNKPGLRVGVVVSGSRGDVQPHVALALDLRSLGHQAPPDLALGHEGGPLLVGVSALAMTTC